MSNRHGERSDANNTSGVLGAVSLYDSAGVVTGLVVKASAGVLYSIFGYNNAATTRYIQLFDLAAVPVNGVVPNFAPVSVPGGENFSIAFTKGWIATTGIVIVSSTSLLTKTITVAADVWLSGEYL